MFFLFCVCVCVSNSLNPPERCCPQKLAVAEFLLAWGWFSQVHKGKAMQSLPLARGKAVAKAPTPKMERLTWQQQIVFQVGSWYVSGYPQYIHIMYTIQKVWGWKTESLENNSKRFWASIWKAWKPKPKGFTNTFKRPGNPDSVCKWTPIPRKISQKKRNPWRQKLGVHLSSSVELVDSGFAIALFIGTVKQTRWHCDNHVFLKEL